MRIYDIAFYVIVFFLFGVLAASLSIDFIIIALVALLAAIIFLFVSYFKKVFGSAVPVASKSDERFAGSASQRFIWLAALSLFIIVGAFYYFWDDYFSSNINIAFGQKINFDGIIIKDSEMGNPQKLIVKLQPPFSGRILAKLQKYPNFNYGDLIKFEGVINPLANSGRNNSYAHYLAKDRIFGIVNYPKAEFISSGNGSKIKSALFSLKEKTIGNFQKVLPSENAAFLAGITLGERGEFSRGFKEAMNKSGTTHLVALSGYNITILAFAVAYVLNSLMVSRRLVFWLTLLVIFGFVIMTGAEASVVRAAIMGGIILLAKRVSRLYSFRNAIAVAAFLMVLENPKVLSFDIGFQLSFMALLGIVYLHPAIQKFFKVSKEPGFLGWRENFLTTLSAQLFVLPLLVLYFGKFSPISLLSNVLILSVIPLTMALGFILGFLGFIYYYFSLIFGWFVNLLLSYETFIIKFLGGLNILQVGSLSIFLAIVYYFILIVFIIYNFPRPEFRQSKTMA